MAVHSLFVSPFVAAYPGQEADYGSADMLNSFFGGEDVKYNILFKKMETIEMDDNDTRTISFDSAYTRAEWTVFFMRVRGKARLNTTAKDINGSSTINGYLCAYGTAKFPGIVFLSSYNIDTFQIECEEDDTKIELFQAVSCADSDTRLTTNA